LGSTDKAIANYYMKIGKTCTNGFPILSESVLNYFLGTTL